MTLVISVLGERVNGNVVKSTHTYTKKHTHTDTYIYIIHTQRHTQTLRHRCTHMHPETDQTARGRKKNKKGQKLERKMDKKVKKLISEGEKG